MKLISVAHLQMKMHMLNRINSNENNIANFSFIVLDWMALSSFPKKRSRCYCDERSNFFVGMWDLLVSVLIRTLYVPIFSFIFVFLHILLLFFLNSVSIVGEL